MLPHDWTDEVEKTPKEVAIDADANDCIRAPKGDGGGNRCPNEANSFDSSAGDDLKGDEACIPGEDSIGGIARNRRLQCPKQRAG